MGVIGALKVGTVRVDVMVRPSLSLGLASERWGSLGLGLYLYLQTLFFISLGSKLYPLLGHLLLPGLGPQGLASTTPHCSPPSRCKPRHHSV